MTPQCCICNIGMKFKERIESKKKYRIRRFECPVCGHIETIYADGYRDLKCEPRWAEKTVKKMYNDESKNRELWN